MPSEQLPIWYLRKYGHDEVFGPVSFEQIRDWAAAAHVNPQDDVSNDGQNWNKAPMFAGLEMDWLVEVPDNPLYGPTSPGAVMEFFRVGEIDESTVVVNCCTGESMPLSAAPFFGSGLAGDVQGVVESLRNRIMELETELAARNADLVLAKQTIDSLRAALEKLGTHSHG